MLWLKPVPFVSYKHLAHAEQSHKQMLKRTTCLKGIKQSVLMLGINERSQVNLLSSKMNLLYCTLLCILLAPSEGHLLPDLTMTTPGTVAVVSTPTKEIGG